MNDVYEKCPDIETDKVLLRFACKEDSVQLLKIYSDKNALPFFNTASRYLGRLEEIDVIEKIGSFKGAYYKRK